MNPFPSEWQDLKVILAHDWLTGMRGGERVLEILCRAFPQAPIYTLLSNPNAISEAITSHRIIASRLRHVPQITKVYRNFLPFFPSAIEKLRPEKAELVISTSHCIAKGLIPPEGARHLCYCFTPMRYAWLFYEEYFGNNFAKKAALSILLRRLRQWDKNTSSRVDHFVTLSKHVQKRIRDFYGRESDVVYPPVDLSFWTPPEKKAPGPHHGYDLVVSALAPYKRIDIAIRAYNKTGYPLKIAGTGTEMSALSAKARHNVSFLGRISDEQLRELYRHCRALIFPGEEDFGLVPVEAQACGRPVVAYGRGGALETIVDNVTGVFFNEQTGDALLEAVEYCAARKWDTAAIRKNAEKFSEQNFIFGLAASAAKCMGK